MSEELPTVERLLALLGHLDLRAAYFAAQMPGDLADLARDHAARIAGLVLCVPTRLDPAPFSAIADRLTMIADAHGMSFEATARAMARLPGAHRSILAGYDAPGWADVVADRGVEITRIMAQHLVPASAGGPVAGVPSRSLVRSGSHAGISYRIEGEGPALVLLPFFLAPSQWDPVVTALAQNFSVIRLGGAHIGGVAALEDRARAPTYRAMFRSLIDVMVQDLNVPAGGLPVATGAPLRFLDVGCGSGALDRLLAQRLGLAALTSGPAIEALDVNAFLLREARGLAKAQGLEHAIRFQSGSAEALPFGDDSFDCAFSVTVLEECDADKAIAEMARVVRPGGRVGVIVRAIDIGQMWSLAVPDTIRERAETPPQSVGQRGVADKSLYARMARAGLRDVRGCPALVTLDRPGSPIWRYREDHVVSQLSDSELAAWRSARDAATATGTLFHAHAMHCVVATKPAHG